MKVKVCGITQYGQLHQLDQLGVEFAGLIFYERSERFVGDKLINRVADIRQLPIKKVGVFVNANLETIKRGVGDYGISYAQLHGDETAAFCAQVNEFVPVIKAVRVSDKTNLKEISKEFNQACSYFLFDTESKEYGGSGKKFSWDLLQKVNISKPFFLSGGIGLEDAQEVSSFNHPQLFAVDVNSRFETEPGIKDMDKVKEFIKALK